MPTRSSLPVAAAFLLAAVPALAQRADFPPGPGRDIVLGACGNCHDINRARAGYTPEGWRTVVRMMQNFDTPIASEDWPIVTQYLIQNFPERPRPAAVLLPGPARIAIKEWPVPTPGSRPHDPLAARDGSIWWTAQLANKLGRLDPKTGDMREFVLKTAHTAPHGLTEDRNGKIWFTGNGIGIIGKLDPNSGAVMEYKLDRSVRDPHTLVFDQSGALWFTAQNANVVGRLDPATGKVSVNASPTPHARPYGIQINSKGVPVVVEFGTNKIAAVDPKTMAFKEYDLPNAAARPRRLAIGPGDLVWYADFARGFLGRLDMASGEVKEWPSPSGPQSRPYGIVFTKGAVWYSESGPKPNTMVRFDPDTEQFQTWAIPGGGDIVRNMDVDPDGNPVLAHSLMNAVGLVKVK